MKSMRYHALLVTYLGEACKSFLAVEEFLAFLASAEKSGHTVTMSGVRFATVTYATS